ncbi:DNA primase regulatory subunit PriL [Halanaeroarchaeum sulfurireducens]|uniref:DNA primase large subunit PriL n=1 Tax=Halanaeroarchaeum sulfurireducens TaxID=1604004 RepID=A0A0F7PEA0_9EURY|nr:DNA primase regulatory subunit PriL [Halanaeroarchaeum sulfurireducens]AKH98535.1 DNA primase large subunit [Halanaeroarchaeum sulfurireducens]
MDARHARYPFLGGAREAVEAAGVDLADVVATDRDVVERAVERVTRALTDREVGPMARSTRVELLSYPVARVLASLVDADVARRRYASAEAATAYERFTTDFDDDAEMRSVGSAGLTRDALLREFGLSVAVRRDGERYRMDVVPYLEYAASLRGEEWRLATRALSDGTVPIGADELDRLLRQAVEERVADGLPLSVPDAISSELSREVATIEETLAELDFTRDIDTVVPELFPPCMQHLLDGIQRGDHLPHHSRFAITSFLANIGLATDEIVDLYAVNPGFGREMTRYQADHIRGDSSPTEYTAPSCATMQAYGDCVNPDDLCDAVSHPLSYYEAKLEDADEDEVTDWRERDSDEDP